MKEQILNELFDFVINNCKIYNIDESHGLGHSMKVYNFAREIYKSELLNNNFLESQKIIIYTSAIIHDMCDKKYMNEEDGLNVIKLKLIDINLELKDIEIILKIISFMSYSKVKINGYPDLGEYQLAYHIVRESDLLAAYDFERCVIFQMMMKNNNYIDSVEFAINLFNIRILKQIEDKLFITLYSNKIAIELHNKYKIENN